MISSGRSSNFIFIVEKNQKTDKIKISMTTFSELKISCLPDDILEEIAKLRENKKKIIEFLDFSEIKELASNMKKEHRINIIDDDSYFYFENSKTCSTLYESIYECVKVSSKTGDLTIDDKIVYQCKKDINVYYGIVPEDNYTSYNILIMYLDTIEHLQKNDSGDTPQIINSFVFDDYISDFNSESGLVTLCDGRKYLSMFDHKLKYFYFAEMTYCSNNSMIFMKDEKIVEIITEKYNQNVNYRTHWYRKINKSIYDKINLNLDKQKFDIYIQKFESLWKLLNEIDCDWLKFIGSVSQKIMDF